MEDRETIRQRIFVICVLAAAVSVVVVLAAFVAVMCSNSDLEVRDAGLERAQEADVASEDQLVQGELQRALSKDERAFMDLLIGSAWFDSLGESSVSFTESEIILADGGGEQRWQYELVSYEAESVSDDVACGVAQLLVDGRERRLTIEPYESVWSYEQNAYDGPYSDCCLTSDLFEMAYYRVVAEDSTAAVVVGPEELIVEAFGEQKPKLEEAINAYCKQNLPMVAEVTYTGEFLVDPETGAEPHIFACKGASEAFLVAVYDSAEQRFAVEKM